MRSLKRLIILATTVIAVGGFAAPASADYLPNGETQADQVDSVDLMVKFLESPQYVPSRLELRKISPDVVGDLVDIVQGDYSNSVRSKAIQSLALYRRDDRSSKALHGLLEDLSPSHDLYPAVIVAYGQLEGPKSVGIMKKLAKHQREDVRMAAIVSLGRFGGQAGYEFLADRLEKEETKVIKNRIKSYVQ